MRNIEELLIALREKYGVPVSWRERFHRKYGQCGSGAAVEDNAGPKTEEEETEETQAEYALFTYNEEQNEKILGQLLRSCSMIEEYAGSLGQGDAVNSAEWKLIRKYEGELEQMRTGSACADGAKLSAKFSKTLKKTLLKLWGCKEYSSIFHRYFNENGIGMESYEPGHKMTDDELCMLEEESIKACGVKTEDLSRKCEVIKMIRPILHIGYVEEEDGDVEYRNIDGVCEFFF